MSDDGEALDAAKPRKSGQLKHLGPFPDEVFFDPLPDEELWWWEVGDEPDPCAKP